MEIGLQTFGLGNRDFPSVPGVELQTVKVNFKIHSIKLKREKLWPKLKLYLFLKYVTVVLYCNVVTYRHRRGIMLMYDRD